MLNKKQVGCRTINATKIRLIKYKINDEEYVLCTTLIDRSKYDLNFKI